MLLLISACSGPAPASPGEATRTAAANTASSASASPSATAAPSTTGQISPTAAAATSTPTASSVVPSATALPVTDVSPTIIDSGLDASAVAGDAIAFNSAASAGGFVWLGSPFGLATIDPANNKFSFVDEQPGGNISIFGRSLWRAAYFFDSVARYDISGRQRVTARIPGPLDVLAASEGVFATEHDAGKLARLDPTTADITTEVELTTPDCCGPADMVMVGGELWVSVNKDKKLIKLNPASLAIMQTVQLAEYAGDPITLASGYLWTFSYSDEDLAKDTVTLERLARTDPATGVSTITEIGVNHGRVTEIGGKPWVPLGDQLLELDPGTGLPVRAVDLGVNGFEGVQADELLGAVWIYSQHDPRILRVSEEELR